MTNPKSRVEFFGVGIDPLSMAETLARAEQIIQERVPTQHVVVNVAKLVRMQKDAPLRDIVNSCGLINADGQGIVWGARVLGLRIPERVAGIDLFLNLVRLAAGKGYRVYFLGARPEVVEKVVSIFRERYPDLEVAGFRDGYFSEKEDGAVAEQVRESEADILFVAMSSPRKETFCGRYTGTMAVPFVMGVGGSFDVVAGVTRRAPVWMQKCGLEWFFRFLCEPRRMWRRYLVSNLVFLGMILRWNSRRFR